MDMLLFISSLLFFKNDYGFHFRIVLKEMWLDTTIIVDFKIQLLLLSLFYLMYAGIPSDENLPRWTS